MPLFTYIVLFFLLELFLIVMAAVEHGWVIFWGEVGTAILGSILIRYAGTHHLRRPDNEALGMQRYLVLTSRAAKTATAGLLLLLPGFITDILGAVLLLSPLFLLAGLFRSVWRKKVEPHSDTRGPRIVDGEVEHPPQKRIDKS